MPAKERFLVGASIAVVYITFFSLTNFAASPSTTYLRADNSVVSALSDAIEDSWSQCILPVFDPWDHEILPFVNPDYDPVKNCKKEPKPLTQLVNNTIVVNSKDGNLKCKNRCHGRISDYKNKVGNWTNVGKKLDCEFVEAVCYSKGLAVHGQMHTQILERSKRTKPTKQPSDVDPKSLKDKYDVYVLLLDSISYSQATRLLPRTMSYLEDSMQAVTFPYINKVGDNSRPNGIALWFGKSLEKVDRSVFGEADLEADWSHNYYCKRFLDNDTSLFNEYRDQGYKTLLAEDWAKGTLNWPNCLGYDNPPVDHYMRPFQLATEVYGENVTKKSLDGKSCREQHHTLMDYLHQFMSAYPKSPKLAWLWMSHLGHNEENSVTHADRDFQAFLQSHREQLDKSFLVVMGDHGLRFGRVTNTQLGSLDVNNPLFTIAIPQSLKTSTHMLSMLKQNSMKLQTHYDIRATLLDIAKFQPNSQFKAKNILYVKNEKGSSLLRRQQIEQRSCRSLPIPLEYCICQFPIVNLTKTSELAVKLGIVVASTINASIRRNGLQDKCLEMRFHETVSATQYKHKFNQTTIFGVVVVMEAPSKARFKVKLRKTADGNVEVLGTISREDSYKHTADCININSFRPYCYCKVQPS